MNQPLNTLASFLGTRVTSETMARWLVLFGGLLGAFVLAYWIALGQITFIVLTIGLVMLVAIIAGMRQRAWLLILMTWSMTAGSGLLPFKLNFRDVSVLLATCAYVAYRIVSHTGSQRKRHPLDTFLIINLLWLVVTYVLHPVGFQVFGATTMGGRPYIEIALAVMAYCILVRFPVTLRTAPHLPLYLLVGGVFLALINIVVYVAPVMTPYLYPFYSGVDVTSYIRSLEPGLEGPTRLIGLRPFGFVTVLSLAAYREPRLLFNPLRVWFYALLLGLAALLASGFRSTLFGVAIMVAIAAWFHRGWRGFSALAMAGGLLIGILILGQGRFYELPLPAQRALSFLPGAWSPTVKAEAEASTEDRLRWWKMVIDEHLIKDWIFGDGFGVAEKDYNAVWRTSNAFDFFQVTGTFHNGFLTTVRYAGLIGLIALYAFMIAAAVYAVRCVRMCRGTRLEPAAIFLAVQLIWIPVEFLAIFGAYEVQLADHIFLAALLLLIWRLAPMARAEAETTKPVGKTETLRPLPERLPQPQSARRS